MKARTLTSGIVAGITLAATVTAGTAAAAPVADSGYRELLGHVTNGQYFEASTPSAGNYAVEYDITSGIAYFDTYINGTELGYAGGPTGTYVTKDISLGSGGQLVQVVGPDGSGQADVYLVSVP